ncbi:MarR family winged helix-turn-helix transcriptional regulator [Agromyces sp. NPDC049794]|uniref:MarR family winged helix-turn-helix transcriptional regulator n=1 Tax=unclassified Agromyces TaxID=2639701 RepID=UPI003403324D
MNPPRQGEPADPDDPVAAVEAALGSLRGRGPGGQFGWRGGHRGPHQGGRPFGGRPHGGHGAPHGQGAAGGRGGHAAVRLLMVLDHHGPSSVTDLASAIGVDQPRASRLAQAAVEAGHVRRDVDPGDARRSILIITDAGRAALSSLLDHRRGAVERALADFTPAERRQFADLLTRFAEAWGRG